MGKNKHLQFSAAAATNPGRDNNTVNPSFIALALRYIHHWLAVFAVKEGLKYVFECSVLSQFDFEVWHIRPTDNFATIHKQKIIYIYT